MAENLIGTRRERAEGDGRGMTGSGVTRSAAGMGVVTAVSRAIGFGRVLFVAAVLGASGLGDTFTASNSLSNVVFELVAAGALSAVLVPTFVRLVERGDDVEAQRLAGGLAWYATLTLGLVAIVGVIAAPLLARVLTAGVSGDARDARALATTLLRWFVPQIVLYGLGALATAALYARRRFAITAAAPIANTIVMVGALALFRGVAGPEPGLVLSSGERVLLGVAGTGGVVGFVGVLLVAARRAGFAIVPRPVSRHDPAFRALVGHGARGVALQSIVGLLLGAAILLGAGVTGGVVAYQAAFVFFLAPYAILAQPLHTAVLPEMSVLAGASRRDDLGERLRWTLRTIAHLVLPATALGMALAHPGFALVRVGALDERGTALVAVAFVGLAAGLLPYSAFLLLARASYALDDSRAPALVAVLAGGVGTCVMAAGAIASDGNAQVAWLGVGHSGAYLLGAVALGNVLARRIDVRLVDRTLLAPIVAAALAGAVAFGIGHGAEHGSRAITLVRVVIAAAAGIATYVAAMRLAHQPLRPPEPGT